MNSRRLIASPEAWDRRAYEPKVARLGGKHRSSSGWPMSALGQKRTFAVQNGMSALRLKATSNATDGMSAKGNKYTAQHSASDGSRCPSSCGHFFYGFGR